MILPLFGVMAMEAGGVSAFIDEPGGANGATFAYLIHLFFFFTAFYYTARVRWGIGSPYLEPKIFTANARYMDLYAMFCAGIFFIIALLMLFAFDALDVLLLKVDKAEFRISLGPFGALITIATKWLIPAMYAALIAAVRDVGWTRGRKLCVWMSGFFLALFGASWGFKTTIMVMLLPAIILVAWTVRARTILLLALFFSVNIFVFSLFFDQSEDIGLAFQALLYRLTVLQGDLAWYTWEKVSHGYETPPYFRTFLPIFGDGLLRQITGANPDKDYLNWASYYFGPSMTLYGGYPVEGVQAGIGNQATMFAESLVVGGRYLFFIVSAFFGAVVGLAASKLREAIKTKNYPLAATLATFFSFSILSWTLGNGFSSLFYLINLIGGFFTYLVISFFLKKNVTIQTND